MTQVVIVGYGMAGARCAAELARFGVKAKVLGAEPHRAYNRILLSNLLAGKTDEAGVELPDAVEDVRPGTRVVGIARAERAVHCEDGEVISYDHLILATGADAWVPPIPGLPAELPSRVAVFRTLDDARRILALAGTARTALVLGGGLLGLEAARGLATRGLDVHVVHPVGHLMERQIDPDAGGILAGTLSDLGITVHTGVSADRYAETDDAVSLSLSDGRTLTGELLVIATGVRPNVELARGAGLNVERGIVVDDRLRTNDRHISAIGDCAQHRGQVGGLVAPAWAQASVVARVLSGEDPLAAYRPTPVVTRLKASGIDLASMGSLAEEPGHEDLRFADPTRGTYARLRIRDDRVTGAVLLGDNPSVGQVIQLFDRGDAVPADRRALLLGRALGGVATAAAAPTPALMPDVTTVCQCNNVSKGAIVSAWRDGCRDTPAIAARTRATTGCGTCTDAVCGISDWLSASEGARG
ncbi:MAG: NAD(P)/FAD-dependent oxidoreductase [Streptomycetaceae bacterium]|nr:NAD(P)/FAD-dependent oxidoreductase [Streptomycetaceae bacterium]